MCVPVRLARRLVMPSRRASRLVRPVVSCRPSCRPVGLPVRLIVSACRLVWAPFRFAVRSFLTHSIRLRSSVPVSVSVMRRGGGVMDMGRRRFALVVSSVRSLFTLAILSLVAG